MAKKQKATKAKIHGNAKQEPDGAASHPVGFCVMPPPKFDGMEELWKVAEHGEAWTCIALSVKDCPQAHGPDGILSRLLIDVAECFRLLKHALATGELLEIQDSREDSAEEVVAVAQKLLELNARESEDYGDFCGVDALDLLASAREALGAPEVAA